MMYCISTFYLNSKAETVTNESDIDDVFESIYYNKHTKKIKEKVQVGLLIQS